MKQTICIHVKIIIISVLVVAVIGLIAISSVMIAPEMAAVEKAGTFDDNEVRKALVGVKFDAPPGPVEVMANHHLSQTVRIGEITSAGQFKILETLDEPVLPQAWNQFEPSSKGYACDWSDSSKGEKYRL